MVFTPAQNITEQIADHLAAKIIHGEMPGGTRIQELKIANELGVSRGSVRESLLLLERRHLIEIVPRKGAVVNQINAEDAFELVDMLASIELRWFHNLIKNRDLADILKVVGQALQEMDQSARGGELRDLVDARSAFYKGLLAPANRYMSGVFDCLFPTSQRLLCILVARSEVDLHDISRYYKAVFDALDNRDSERLDELLKAFHKRLQNLYKRTFTASSSGKAVDWSANARVLGA